MSSAMESDNLSKIDDDEVDENIGVIVDSDDDEVPPPPTHYDDSDDDEVPPPPTHDDYSDDDDEVQLDSEEVYNDDMMSPVISIKSPPITLSQNVDEDEDDDSDNEQEYNKLELDNYQNTLLDYHQSSISHNSEEIAAMTQVIRDSKNNIIDDLHKTVPILSKYERTRVLGQRAKQIENGHSPFVRVSENVIDSYIIAVQELEQHKLPFIIRRPMPSGGSEYWHLKDLELV
jgi:DNA-directed RNA polymerase subunit K/omega